MWYRRGRGWTLGLAALAVLACNRHRTSGSGGDDEGAESETRGGEDEEGGRCAGATRVVDADVVVSTSADMDALADVAAVRGDFDVVHTELSELVGANCLTHIGGRLTIGANDSLERIDDAFTSLTTIGDAENGGGGLTLDSNEALQSVRGLAALETVEGRVLILDNSDLSYLDVTGLARVGDWLLLGGNISMLTLQGFTALEEVEGRLSIADQDGVADLDGLGALRRVGGLSVYRNDSLRDLDGLGLEAIEGQGLLVQENPVLENLRGLEGVSEIAGNVEVRDNPQLIDVRGLDALERVTEGEYMTISRNASLASLDGLAALTQVEGMLHVCDNPSLVGLAELASLDEVEHLTVIYNDTLADVDGDELAAQLSSVDWVKVDANGVLGPVWNDKDPCPWAGDSVCDADQRLDGDAVLGCEGPDCCDVFGPTNLCTGESEGDDCVSGEPP